MEKLRSRYHQVQLRTLYVRSC